MSAIATLDMSGSVDSNSSRVKLVGIPPPDMISGSAPPAGAAASTPVAGMASSAESLQFNTMAFPALQDNEAAPTKVVDVIDASNEDPFTLDSFDTLIRAHMDKKKDFLIARVITMDENDNGRLYYSYYAAHHINKVLFRTQPEEGLLHRMKAKNVSVILEKGHQCTVGNHLSLSRARSLSLICFLFSL
jgi:hypothetical protein